MDRATYESQKAFAGDKISSMQRRCVDNDYTERRMYMITMVTEGRRPLFGEVAGRSEATEPSPDAPHIVLTRLGEAVAQAWHDISTYHPEVEVVALQMMPDHLHGILFVKEKMEKPLGKVLLGFKQGCNKAFRELLPSDYAHQDDHAHQVESVAVLQQQTEQQQTNEVESVAVSQQPPKYTDRKHGLLFAKGYNDRILFRQGQLERWLHYLKDNPRRLLMKRENPELFRVQRGLKYAGMSFSAIGNRFLLEKPMKVQVQCSRRMTDEEVQRRLNECLALARQGAVMVSPAISQGEKAIMRAVFDEGLPVIYLQENGFTDLAKPGGKRMEACARGQLLILAPWEHHNERLTIKRGQCLQLNDMARAICEGPA
ncbi:MAG: hypothetical protein IKQ47_00020 [Prevotella sp.]|nr:hypothetical protein [Prevotella sp.]